MVSRENRVQLAAIAIAFVVLIALAFIVPNSTNPSWVAGATLVFYAIAFGGAHWYLYFRADSDAVPRSSRGRFLKALAIVLPLWAGAIALQGWAVYGGVQLSLILGGLSLAVLVGYVLYEMRLGYDESMSARESR